MTVLEDEGEDTNDGPPSIKLTGCNRDEAVRFAEELLNVLLDGKSHLSRPTTTDAHFLSLAMEEYNPDKDEYKNVEIGLLGGCFSEAMPLEAAMRLCEKVTEWARAAYDTRQELKKYA